MAGKPRASSRNVIHFKAWRLHAGRTQREVAEALGVGTNTVSYWDGGRSPQIEHLPGIAKIFGCTIDMLFQRPPTAL
jgi:transcriptional regulator with XRE-family HTH domain